MSTIDWSEVARVADWDHVVRINSDGSISEPEDRYAAPVYWDEATGQTTLEHPDNGSEYTVRTFHSSEFLEPANYIYHLSEYTNDGTPVEFWLTSVTDLNDSEPVGWALVIHELPAEPVTPATP